MVLLKGNHTTLEDMPKTARTLSSDAKPKKLSQVFEKVNFKQIDIDKFQALEPKFTYTVAKYTDFFRTLSKEIKKGLDKGSFLVAKKKSRPQCETKEKFVMPNKILWGNLGQLPRTIHLKIVLIKRPLPLLLKHFFCG